MEEVESPPRPVWAPVASASGKASQWPVGEEAGASAAGTCRTSLHTPHLAALAELGAVGGALGSAVVPLAVGVGVAAADGPLPFASVGAFALLVTWVPLVPSVPTGGVKDEHLLDCVDPEALAFSPSPVFADLASLAQHRRPSCWGCHSAGMPGAGADVDGATYAYWHPVLWKASFHKARGVPSPRNPPPSALPRPCAPLRTARDQHTLRPSSLEPSREHFVVVGRRARSCLVCARLGWRPAGGRGGDFGGTGPLGP